MRLLAYGTGRHKTEFYNMSSAKCVFLNSAYETHTCIHIVPLPLMDLRAHCEVIRLFPFNSIQQQQQQRK